MWFRALWRWLAALLSEWEQPYRRAVRIAIRVRLPGGAWGDVVSLILTDEQKVTLSVQPLTAAGHPAPVDGPPVWTSSNPAAAQQLVVAPDGLSATFFAGGLGDTQIVVTADADLGAGVTTIQGVLDVSVVAAQAVSLGIVAGTPEVK